MLDHPPTFIRLTVFAQRQGVHVSTIYRNRKAYPPIDKVGGLAVIWVSNIDQWTRDNRKPRS